MAEDQRRLARAGAGSTGGKKIQGRKRPILVDTQGNLLLVPVDSAGWSDAEGGTWLLAEGVRLFRTVLKVWADSAYQGDLVPLVQDLFGVDLEIVVKEANQKGFVLQARRWVVERSLGGYSRNRRLSKDYEHLCETSEAIVYIASIQVMLRRLRPNANDKQPYLRRKTPRAA